MLQDALKDKIGFGAWKKADGTKTNASKNKKKKRVDQVLLLWVTLELHGSFPWVHIGATNSKNSPLLLHRLVKGAVSIISSQLPLP